MVVLVDRGDGVWNGVAVPVVGFDLGNGDGGGILFVEGNQVPRVVGCRVELVGEFGYIGIGLRFNDNRGGGVGCSEVVGNGVIEIYGVFPLEFYIVFRDGNHATERVGIVAFCRSLNESEDGCTCIVGSNGVVGCVIGDNYAFVAMFLYVVARQIVLNGVIQWSIDIGRGQSGLASVELEVCHPSVVHLFAVGGGTFDVGNEFVVYYTFHRYKDALCLVIDDDCIAERAYNRRIAGDSNGSAALSICGTDIVCID